jgi:hypothetical protein
VDAARARDFKRAGRALAALGQELERLERALAAAGLTSR